MKSPLIALVSALIAFAFGCSSSSKKDFNDITPGMSRDDVKEAMNAGPTAFKQVEGTDYAVWNWGDRFCVLFKGDEVVAKENLGPAKYEETRKAQCLAPGQVAEIAAIHSATNLKSQSSPEE